MANSGITIGADLNEAFKLQNFTARDAYPVLDVIDDEIDKHYNESFEKKFNEMFNKRFDEEFNKRLELLLREVNKSKNFSFFGFVKSSVSNVLTMFLNILKENRLVSSLLHKSENVNCSNTEPLPEPNLDIQTLPDQPDQPDQSNQPNQQEPELEPPVEYRELSFDEKLKVLMKQREDEMKDLFPPPEEASKQFSKFMKERDSLVNNVYKQEMIKKGFMVPVSKNTESSNTESLGTERTENVATVEEKIKTE